MEREEKGPSLGSRSAALALVSVSLGCALKHQRSIKIGLADSPLDQRRGIDASQNPHR